MLSKQAIPLIKASVPILREHGVQITSVFYKSMFEAHPELKNLFNLGNQQSGEQQQALAGAVYAYAANIENPAALTPVLTRIAHKHASLGITPAQYTIVGKYLLGAIAEVLGDQGSPELLQAWDEAYWVLAGELIALEARLYHDKQLQRGDEWQNLIVQRIEEETQEIVSVYLKAENNQSPPSFRPGQYVSVAVDVKDAGIQQIRQYSLSDASDNDCWRLTIKKERQDNKPNGLVSNIVATLQTGDSLRVSQAYGDFTLEQGFDKIDHSLKPIIFISAGVGITPMVSMLNTLSKSASQRCIRFVYGARSRSLQPLKTDLSNAKEVLSDFKVHNFYDQPSHDDEDACQGLVDLESIKSSILLKDATYYLCGSLPFMRIQRDKLLDLNVPTDNIKYEVFGPDLLNNLQ